MSPARTLGDLLKGRTHHRQVNSTNRSSDDGGRVERPKVGQTHQTLSWFRLLPTASVSWRAIGVKVVERVVSNPVCAAGKAIAEIVERVISNPVRAARNTVAEIVERVISNPVRAA